MPYNPTLQDLLNDVDTAQAYRDAAAAQVLSANTALTTATAAYSDSLAAFRTALNTGNQSTINAAAQDVLTANSALTGAQASYDSNVSILTSATVQLTTARAALQARLTGMM